MITGRARPLVRYYFLGLAAAALPLLLLVAGVALTQFAAERAAQLDLIARDVGDLQLALDALIKPAGDHVRQLRLAAEDHLAGRLATPASPLRPLLQSERWDSEGMTGEGLFLQGVAGSEMEPLVGNLHGRADLLSGRSNNLLEIDVALGLFEPMRLAHLSAPHLRWSYYFSARGDFLALYPFSSARTATQGLGLRTVDDYLAAVYAYDVYRLGTPAENPQRRDYWTPVYADAGGAGWMVSHAAPVYADGAFSGIVGTDILLDFLNVFLTERHRAPGRVWILDRRGELLADSAGVAVRSTRPLALADVLPQPLAAHQTELLGRPGMLRRVNGWEVMALPLAAAPWAVLFVVGEREITWLVLRRLWPYALLLAGGLATLVLALLLQQWFFVRPAIALASRVQEQSEGEPGRVPLVPGVWRPWFAAVDEAFQSGRRHLARIREEQALKAAIVEASFDSIITTDEEGRILEFSAGAEAIFGYRRADALGRPIAELIIPQHLREQHTHGIRRYLATGERRMLGRRIETEGQRADGSCFPIELAIAEVRLADRRLFTAYLRDITERRRTEQALQDSERQFRAVVEDQTELICRFDCDFRLTFTNRAHARLFDVEPEALVGQDLFSAVPLELREPLRTELLALTPENPIQTGENEKLLSNGEVRWFDWTNRALFDNTGRRIGYQSVGRDITSQKRAEAAHRQREKLAALGSLLAGVAHELNNPLSVVVGRAIMLESEVDDPAVRASLGRLRAAAERCTRIVKSFLTLARQKPREPRPVDVRAVLDAVLEILAGGLRSAGVELRRQDAPDLPLVVADEDELHQLFFNLVSNAQQALETAPPPRQLELRATAGDGFVRIDVADNGPGVPATLRDQIFEPFFTTKPVGAGTGLGLSICHGIVSAHGGTIAVDERPGGGACFVVTLPASAADVAPPAPPAPSAAVTASGACGDVLVVDDEAEVVAMLKETLARDGHWVVTAPDGAVALKLLRAVRFDAVLCDVRMPRLDGPGLARALELIRPDMAARLLLMTGDALRAADALPPETRGRILEKPLNPDEVRRRVRDLIARGH